MLRQLALLLRRVMLRTGQGPLRGLWAAGYELLLRRLGAALLEGADGGVFVGGSFGHGEPVYGISDLDLIVVLPEDGGRACEKARLRWQALCRSVPPLSLAVADVFAYEEPDLREAVSSTCLTYGLDGPGRAAFLGSSTPDDSGGLLVRPGLWPTQEWRLVSGRDLRPAADFSDLQHRRIAAWLELQFWWRFAFKACLEPTSPHTPFLCLKLVAEPARIWLWLVHGEQIFPRRQVLRRALQLLPEEEPAIRLALRLHDAAGRLPEPPLAGVLPTLVRLSALVAQRIADEIADAGATEVRLVGAGSEIAPELSTQASLLPLADWRALALPALPDETFTLTTGDPADAELLARAALGHSGTQLALHTDGLLLLPGPPKRVRLRAVQCTASDPVSLALVEQRKAAAFPRVAGWSAHDWAARAVSEHRAWLDAERASERSKPVRVLGMLLSAARAALFHESIEESDPELALTVTAAAERLGARLPGRQDAIAEALAEYRAARLEGARIDRRTIAALHGAVCQLPAYDTARPR